MSWNENEKRKMITLGESERQKKMHAWNKNGVYGGGIIRKLFPFLYLALCLCLSFNFTLFVLLLLVWSQIMQFYNAYGSSCFHLSIAFFPFISYDGSDSMSRALICWNSNRQFVVMNDVCVVIYCVRRWFC